MRAGDLQRLLEPYGIRPIKGRGQHFLLDENAVRRMADAAAVGEGDRVLEIGPGPGILTSELLSRGAAVVAVELDLKLSALLEGRFVGSPRFRLLRGDVLAFPNAALVKEFSASPYKVVANIPYAITSPILEKFLLEAPTPATITLMVQKEVADRIAARPGAMSALSVFAQTLAEVRKVFDIPPGAFYPPPKVRSAVIHMRIRTPQETKDLLGNVDRDRFFRLVRAGFSQKRKQLKNSLRTGGFSADDLKKAFIEAKISDRTRPEELGVAEWVRLAVQLRLFAEE